MPTPKQLKDPEKPASDEAPVMSGHPADDPPLPETPPAAPEAREVTINGRKFRIEPDLAEAMAQRDRDIDRKMNEHAQELGRLRQQTAQVQTPAAPKGYDTLLFEDPVGAVNRLKQEIRQEYVQEKKLEQFWNKFYRSNKDLDRDDDDFIVKAVLNENLQGLAQLPEEEAAEKLADLSRRQILKYQSKKQDDDSSRARVEGVSPPSVRSVPPRVEGPSSLTDLIKKRRAARQKTG